MLFFLRTAYKMETMEVPQAPSTSRGEMNKLSQSQHKVYDLLTSGGFKESLHQLDQIS